MEIVLIAAISKDRVIGKQGGIPWKLKEDLSFFREKTLNASVIMGRATFESIGRPLPNRLNIVMTRSAKNIEGIVEAASAEEALKAASKHESTSEVFVIGGENIYKVFLPFANRMIITEVELEIEGGDTFFPEWNIDEWKELSRDRKEENGIKFSFVNYERKLDS